VLVLFVCAALASYTATQQHLVAIESGLGSPTTAAARETAAQSNGRPTSLVAKAPAAPSPLDFIGCYTSEDHLPGHKLYGGGKAGANILMAKQ